MTRIFQVIFAVLVFFAVVMLSGCVGVATMHNPKHVYGAENVKPGARGWCCQGSNLVRTKADVRTTWGEPDKTWQEGALEKWEYDQSDLSWAGVIPMIIIPIPLLVPTGHNYTIFTFSGEQLISAESTDREGIIAFCGILPSDEGHTLVGCTSG